MALAAAEQPVLTADDGWIHHLLGCLGPGSREWFRARSRATGIGTKRGLRRLALVGAAVFT